MDYIVLAIPAFFLLIGLELLIARLKKTELYRFNDAITNISCGISQQTGAVFIKTLTFLLYVYVFEHWRIISEIPETFLTYTILFIGVDFFYYWFHRYAHEISAFWGTHIVHHQSEEYNLSVALRQSLFQSIISSLFYLPLALIGFNPIAFFAINAFQTLYQFWIHTKTINKLPAPIEFLFNTPSHHRVHHGVNPKYIDRNHGGTLIIFDRLFGTFQKEEEEVVYGVTVPLASWNPIWANIDYYASLFKSMKQVSSLKDKLRMLFYKPGWQPAALGGPIEVKAVKPEEVQKFDTQIPVWLNYYVLFQYAFVLGGATLFLFTQEEMTWTFRILGTGLVMLSVMNLGGIFESKAWAWWAEIFRLIAIPVFVYASLITLDLTYMNVIFIGLLLFSLLSLFWFSGFREMRLKSREASKNE